MNAKEGARPSWAWASILTVRDVVRTNGVRHVRNGKRVRIFQDAWVPRLRGYKLR